MTHTDPPSALRTSIGEQIARLRQERQWTLAELSERAGLDPGGLSKMERGLKAIHDHHLEVLAAAFGVHPADLLPGALRAVDRAVVEAIGAADISRAVDALATACDTTVPHLLAAIGHSPVVPAHLPTDELSDLGRASAAMTRAADNMTRHLARIVAEGGDAEAVVARWMQDVGRAP